MSDRDRRAVDFLGRVFDAWHDEHEMTDAEYRRRRFDFAFHMTDWLADLERLHAVLADPDRVDPEAYGKELYGTLSHIIPHLRAAFRAFEGHEANDPFLAPEPLPAPVNGVPKEAAP